MGKINKALQSRQKIWTPTKQSGQGHKQVKLKRCPEKNTSNTKNQEEINVLKKLKKKSKKKRR